MRAAGQQPGDAGHLTLDIREQLLRQHNLCSRHRWPGQEGQRRASGSRAEKLGPEGRWVHYGLTSSDVVDTAWCVALTRASDLLIGASDDLIEALRARALEHRDTPMVGRTHGIHAEPTTFGRKLALWALQADRDAILSALAGGQFDLI